MFEWTVIFIILALIAAIFGFAGIAIVSIWTAKFLFFTFLALSIDSLVIAVLKKKSSPLIINI